MNHSFGFVVFALAEMMVTHMPVGIDEIVRGPIFVIESAPDFIFVVDRNGISDLQVGNRVSYVFNLALEGRRV